MFRFIKIEDPSRFLDQFKPLEIHPHDPLYIPFWRDMKRKCIEGLWFEDFNGKWRYGRGNLGFYGHYCTLIDTDKKTKSRKTFRPDIRDLEWHRSYYILEAKGFSGFTNDDKYTSYENIKSINKNELDDFQKKAFLKSNGQFKEYVNPREYLFATHDKPLGLPQYLNQTKSHLEFGCRGSGKDLEENTLVYTENGPVKIKDIKVGDRIYGADGKLTTIIQRRDFNDQMQYKITFKDGRSIECGGGHLWTVINSRGRKQTLELNDIKTNYRSYQRPNGRYDTKYFVQQCNPIEYQKKELPIDPYYVGLWLGDGNSHNTGVTTMDDEIVEFLYYFAESWGLHVQINENVSKTCPTYNLNIRKGDGRYTNPLLQELKNLNLIDNKHIPNIYKYSSVEQRLALVRGLMDADGYCDDNHIDIILVNEKLIDDLREILLSLGCKAKKTVKYIEEKPYYRLHIVSPISIFSLKRKQSYWDDENRSEYSLKYRKSKQSKNGIELIEPVCVKPSVCIAVDNEDSLFVAGDYIVTHNSYYYALGEMKYNLCFSGLKSFDIDNIDYILNNLPVVHQNLGAAIKSKAFETAKKIDESLRELKINKDLGAFYLGPEEGWVPNPFWIRMNGSYDPDKSSSWQNLHRVKRGNEWIIEGEGHSIETKIYSPNKRTGAQAGAGGRKDFILYEEIGLFEELLTAWMSDEAVISVEGDRFGVKVGIGTSGNIDTIEPARKIFMHPTEYKCLEFTEFDEDAKTCFFLADWMVDRRFKDKHGMTDEEAAIEHHKNEHKLREDTGDPDIINGYRMNNPHKIEHMWLSHEGNLLPTKEAEVREKQLLKGNLYEKLGTPVVLFADPRKPEGVSYEVDHESKPILSMTDDNMEGCIMMYEQPFRYNGQIPPDAHFIFHDPYFSEAMDKGGSIGATIVLINPKYIPQGSKGNCIAMTYFGKNPNGLDAYNRNLELICQFYGNPHRKLWYEANKGEFVRSYFIHPSRRKAYLLCLRPQFVQGAHVYKKNTPYTGFMVPNGVAKLNMITKLNDWLLEETTLIDQETQKEETLANIFRIPDLLLIRQIKAYTLKGNFDTVSALLAAPLALEEEEHVMKDKLMGQNRPHDNYTSKLLKRYGKARTNIRS